MLSLLPLLALPAVAGDQALYARAVELIDNYYLRGDTITAGDMLAEAADQLESRIQWLLTDADGDSVTLHAGEGGWTAEVHLERPDDLPAALARLEDAVRGAGLPIDPDTDLRVEILRGVSKTLDRHSVVLWADSLERFDERLSGTLSGVGATIGTEDGVIVVRAVNEAGPAERAGLLAGDHILSIDGVSTIGMVSRNATDRIRGPAGSTVTLVVSRGEQVLSIAVSRAEITIRNVEASRGPKDVGVVTIHHFSEQTRTYLNAALAELDDQKLLDRGVIIDLRGNTGGSLIQSAAAADTFLDSGLIVSTVGRNGAPVPGLMPRIQAHDDVRDQAVPVVILMDHSTASGSEILAGALAQLDRAALVGTTSYGKGTVQKIYALAPDIKLKLTVAEYLLQGDVHVADIGLAPDFALEEVRFDEGSVWYPSPTRERRGHPEGTPTVRVVDGEDRALELAAAIVIASSGPTRAELVAAARAQEGSLRATEDARVADAFRERGIDWSPAPTPTEGAPAVDVRWRWSTPLTSGRSAVLSATVTNLGPPLHRAALRLSSDNPALDDRLVPIGLLPREGVGTGSVTVSLPTGGEDRLDRVRVALETEAVTAAELPPLDVHTLGEPLPNVSVTVRASPPSAGVVRVRIDVENQSERLLNGVSARFAFPDVEGVELLQSSSTAVSVAARGTARLELGLRVGPAWTGNSLPLELAISGIDYGRLANLHVDLPRGGAVIHLSPPTLTVQAPPTTLPPGKTRLKVRAVDDRAVDHVLVWAGTERMDRRRSTPNVDFEGDKIAWRRGTGRRAELDVELDVEPGLNHYVVIAEDRTGLRSVRDLYVYGDEGPAGLTASPD